MIRTPHTAAPSSGAAAGQIAAYDVVPRAIRTEFVAAWEGCREDARARAEHLRAEIVASVLERRPHELTPFHRAVGRAHPGRAAGGRARAMVAEAERALAR